MVSSSLNECVVVYLDDTLVNKKGRERLERRLADKFNHQQAIRKKYLMKREKAFKFPFVPIEFAKDKQFLLNYCSFRKSCELNHFPNEWFQDSEFIKSLIRIERNYYHRIPVEFQNSDLFSTFLEQGILLGDTTIITVPDMFLNDEYIKNLISCYPSKFKESIQNDPSPECPKDILLKLSENGMNIERILQVKTEFEKDFEFWKKILSRNGELFQYCDDKENEELILISFKQCSSTIKYISDEKLNDLNFRNKLLNCVGLSPKCSIIFEERMKQSREILSYTNRKLLVSVFNNFFGEANDISTDDCYKIGSELGCIYPYLPTKIKIENPYLYHFAPQNTIINPYPDEMFGKKNWPKLSWLVEKNFQKFLHLPQAIQFSKDFVGLLMNDCDMFIQSYLNYMSNKITEFSYEGKFLISVFQELNYESYRVVSMFNTIKTTLTKEPSQYRQLISLLETQLGLCFEYKEDIFTQRTEKLYGESNVLNLLCNESYLKDKEKYFSKYFPIEFSPSNSF